MADSDVFRCDYDGTYAPRNRARIYWHEVETLEDGTVVWKAAVYCGEFCASQAAKYDVAVGS